MKMVELIYAYAGFWIRAVASIIDGLLRVLIFLLGLLVILNVLGFVLIDERSGLLQLSAVLLDCVYTLGFWFWKSATPGKLAFKIYIVDAKTGGRPTRWQFAVRYIAYLVSWILFGLGILWVAFDERKQGWHDKIADTLVVKKKTKFFAESL